MKRLNRLKKLKLEYEPEKSLYDLMDNHIKSMWRATDSELDHICNVATDEELDALIGKPNMSFSEKRQMSVLLDKYLDDDKIISTPSTTDA